jgi:hypothetical protein
VIGHRREEANMTLLLDVLAEVMVLGSIALLIWGGMLTLGHLFRSDRRAKGTRASPARGGRPDTTRQAGVALTVVAAALSLPTVEVRAQGDFERAMEAAGVNDYAGTIEPLRRASRDGNMRAQEILGFMLLYGERLYGQAVKADVREGVAWLQRAEAQGSEVAPHMLARLDRRGAELAAAD